MRSVNSGFDLPPKVWIMKLSNATCCSFSNAMPVTIAAYKKQAAKSIMLLLLPIIIPFIFPSCQYDPHAHLLTTTEPEAKDIIGTYVLDRYDLPSVSKIKHMPMRLELYADSTFRATNIPPWDLDSPDDSFFSDLLSGTGRWEKASLGMVDPGSKTIWGIYLRSKDRHFHPAGFTSDKPPYGLIFTLGDPDGGNAVILRKDTSHYDLREKMKYYPRR